MKHYPQPAIHDYKIFERNDIAKYGIMFITYKALDPIQYKSLMYLLWKSLQQNYRHIDGVALSISELLSSSRILQRPELQLCPVKKANCAAC